METATIIRLLSNAGFRVLGTDGANLYIEDPSCILRSFQTFTEYAWIILTFITGMLIFGWAISMIRGAKNNIFINLRNLTIMFGTLAAAGAILNMIYGGDLFARGCQTVAVDINTVNEMLDMRQKKMSPQQTDLYESIDIYDSGVVRANVTANNTDDDHDNTSTDNTVTGDEISIPDDADDKFIPISQKLSDTDKDKLLDILRRAPDDTLTIPRDQIKTDDDVLNKLPNGGLPIENIPSVDELRDRLIPAPSQRDATANNPSAHHPSNPSEQEYTSAAALGRDVVYTTADGRRVRRTGGTRAWRNLNPGNIRYSEFSRNAGAIGQAGGFAVFPDEETGTRAISSLLRGQSYNNLTIARAITRYAPPSENNTAAYHRRIQQITGLNINRRISDLSDGELSRVVDAIRAIEGWEAGRIIEE